MSNDREAAMKWHDRKSIVAGGARFVAGGLRMAREELGGIGGLYQTGRGFLGTDGFNIFSDLRDFSKTSDEGEGDERDDAANGKKSDEREGQKQEDRTQ